MLRSRRRSSHYQAGLSKSLGARNYESDSSRHHENVFPKIRRFRKIASMHLLCVAALSFAGADFLCRNVAAQTAAGVSASAFHVGDRVQATGSSAIFAAPPSAGRFAGNQAANAVGSISNGPVRVGDVWWWKVDFDSGNSGWMAERQLHNLSGRTATQDSNTGVNSTPSPSNGSFVSVNPPNGSTVGSSRVVLQGTVTNDVYAPWLITFSVNGTPVTLDRNGKFNLRVTLRSGANTFTFQADQDTNPRQQTNQITSYLDGSVIYGSDATRAAALRTFQGGALKTSTGNLPPLNTAGLPNANDAHLFLDAELFLAGDVRANCNVELSAIHALFVREHNQIAAAIAAANHSLSDEQIFQMTRRIVAGEIQAITYNEFLPALLGSNRVTSYSGYDADVNAGIANGFTAAYRIGHTLINDDVEFLDNDGNPVRDELDLDEAFFNPAPLKEVGPNTILKYLATDNAQEVDPKLVGGLQKFSLRPSRRRWI